MFTGELADQTSVALLGPCPPTHWARIFGTFSLYYCLLVRRPTKVYKLKNRLKELACYKLFEIQCFLLFSNQTSLLVTKKLYNIDCRSARL